jgi:hypothetical protein
MQCLVKWKKRSFQASSSNSNDTKSGLTYEQEDHSEHHLPILELLLPSYTRAVVIQDIPADLQHCGWIP